MKRFTADLLILLFLGVLLTVLPPLWRTNDDIAMSMLAHGYGLASEPSPYLLFSNTLWLHVLSLIPNIGGSTPYALASTMILFICCLAFLLIARRLNTPRLTSHSAILLVMVGPILSPQFTINAGLCTIVGLLLFKLYDARKNKTNLIAGFVFLCFGFLIREHEALLIGFVALPLFLKWDIVKDRSFQVCGVFLLVFASTAFIINNKTYSDPLWHDYHELNSARIPYTDFKFDKLILNKPALMAKEGMSKNDIKLVTRWFFEDREIASAEKLSRMVQETSGELAYYQNIWPRIKLGFRTFKKNSSLLVFSALGLFILFLSMNARLAFAWLQLAIAVCIVSALGRPSVARIYEPVLIFLCLYPLLFYKFDSWRLKVLPIATCFTMSIGVGLSVHTHNKRLKEAKEYQRHFNELLLGVSPLIVWGSSLKYEYLFTPFKIADLDFKSLDIYGLGVFSYAPNSIAQRERDSKRSILELLLSDQGATIVLSKRQKNLLATYCQEHFGATLMINSESRLGRNLLVNVHCIK